ncbi:putative lipid II flippase FtsW [Hydrogenibacillus sp. N12]|uniref:putative lipid II flippase FtsW n=1 Tax=Hydrogenibacillus sp. N12 TaxID=2866627 RepID=UPI001C7D69B3|nr:putative lipid II flippase FtsW [Hydrogenibacillus sp. N12]QZA33952.1 putative lipid II flippase FtsW [Hydrogenibacillus sp. N12]
MGRKASGTPALDGPLVGAVVGLLGLGVVMVLSASAAIAAHEFGDPFFYAKRQLLFAVLGLMAFGVTSKVEPVRLKPFARQGYALALLLLVIVLIPGIGVVRGGARSWIGIGAFSIQPAELAKLALIVFLAAWLERKGAEVTAFGRGFVPPLLYAGLMFGLIMLQPDLGTGTVLLASAVVMMFAAGVRLLHLALFGLAGMAGFLALVLAAPYRVARIVAYLDPWQDPLGAGYQTIQSLLAIGPGGLLGLGLGMSRQKYAYLPEPYNDFIFSITAEELGFVGAMLVLALFGVVVWRGVVAALRAPDAFSAFVAVGVTAMIAVQVLINIGVVVGLLPVTGITLPLFSAGGSSLVIVLAGLGMVHSVLRHRLPV